MFGFWCKLNKNVVYKNYNVTPMVSRNRVTILVSHRSICSSLESEKKDRQWPNNVIDLDDAYWICLFVGVRDYIHVMDLADGHSASIKKIEENPGLKVTENFMSTIGAYFDKNI